MNILELIKKNKLKYFKVELLGIIFLIFLLNFFIDFPLFVYYLLPFLIILNLVLGIKADKKRIGMNIGLILLSLLLFVPFIGIFATMIGIAITLIYFIIDTIEFFKS